VIAHRLSTIIDAGEIPVIERERIVECGSHSRLAIKDCRYVRMRGLPQQEEQVSGLRIE